MIYNTTYYDKEINREINKMLGKPFTPLSVIKIGVIGSSRMIIDSNSVVFDKLVKLNKDLTYANIGLRPKGIIVILSKSYKNLSWVIPYHFLSVYKTNVLSIHSQGQVLKLRIKGNQNMKFVEKVLDRKAKYLNSVC